jgi:hypothetical protein
MKFRLLERIGDVLTRSTREQQQRLAEELKTGLQDSAVQLQNLERYHIQLSIVLARMEREIGGLQISVAEPAIERVRQLPDQAPLAEADFGVFSQMGEDGILQYIFSRIDVPRKYFVEFGVQDYRESNTRLLLVRDGWTGLVMDCGQENVASIRQQEVCWRHGLDATCVAVTRENINRLLQDHGVEEDLGLLSIDVDGMDYWIWEAVEAVRPRVVVCEYNSLFGAEHAVTVPYRADFDRTRAHYSNLYFGASLPALCKLADRKGYHFIGCTRFGHNAFFVLKELSAPFQVLDPAAGYVESRFRESRDEEGALTFLSGLDRIREIQECEVIHLDRDQRVRIKDLLV